MTDFRIQVTVDPKGAVEGAKDVENALGGIEDKQKDVKKSSGALGAALKVAATLLATKEVLQSVNAYQELQNRLTQVSTGTQNLADITDELFDVAQRSRTSFESTADLYTRVAKAGETLGVSQREILEVTEAVNKAVALSGQSSAESAAGIEQLGRALSAGTISGGDFNSILKQLPDLGVEIAAGLGVSVEELKKLAAQGAVTSEALFGAIAGRIPEIEEKYGKLGPTISSAFTTLKNSALGAVGALVTASGAGDGLAVAIETVSRQIDLFVDAVTGTLEPADELSATMQNVAIAMIATGGAISGLIGILGALKDNFARTGKDIGGFLAGTVAALKGDFSEAGTIFDEVFNDSLNERVGSATDFFEEFASTIDNTSLKINDVLLPAFRATKAEISTLTDEKTKFNLDLGAAEAAAALEALRDKQADFIADLKLTNEAFAIAAETGRDYNRVLEDLELRDLAGGDVIWQAEAQALLDASRNAQDYADAKERLFETGADNKEFLLNLLEENEALEIAIETGRELNDVLEEMAIRKRFAGDEKTLGEALDLQEANIRLRDQLGEAEDEVNDFLRKARENAQDLLGDFLANAFTGGIDDIPLKFSRMLLELSSQLLASEIFKLLGNIGGGASGGAGFLSLIGGFFGGAADGADVGAGDFGIVGENGPELFQAPRAGSIIPNGNGAAAAPQVNVPVQVINVRDPSEIPAALQSQESKAAILNMVSSDRNAFNAALGGAV